MKQAGLSKERAQEVLKLWRAAAGAGDGKEVSPENLRKVGGRAGGPAVDLSCPPRLPVAPCLECLRRAGRAGRRALDVRSRPAPEPSHRRRRRPQVLVKQGSKFSALIVIQIFLDLGAAYGALLAGAWHARGAADGR